MTDIKQNERGLSWFGILRLGLVMFALGSIVVLTTSVFNRVINYEYGLPAMIAGILVGWREALQFLRPRWGYGSDKGGRRTPWIVWGMLILAIGGSLGALATVLMDTSDAALFSGPFAGVWPGFALGFVAYTLIGIGVGAAGTCLLALLATAVAPPRRPAAAALVWILMIVGFAVTTGVASQFIAPPEEPVSALMATVDLDVAEAPAAVAPLPGEAKPAFSPLRLLLVCWVICAAAFVLAFVALWGLEGKKTSPPSSGDLSNAPSAAESQSFWQALRLVWSEPRTRNFGIFVLIAMLAFEAQLLIMEPFGAHAFGLAIDKTTAMASFQHGGVAVGMLLVGLVGSICRGTPLASFRLWAIVGCLMSGIAHIGLVMAGFLAPDWPLNAWLVFLGFSNGVFAVAAIGSMMTLASDNGHGSEGTRMGVWGTAQAIALGTGAVLGTMIADAGYWLMGSRVPAFQSVFALEAALFLVAAYLAFRLGRFDPSSPAPHLHPT